MSEVKKLQKLYNYEFFESVKNGLLQVYDDVFWFRREIERSTAIDIEHKRSIWSELLTGAKAIRDGQLNEFESVFGTALKNFLLVQTEALEEFILALDKFLDAFRHDNLYVYAKPLSLEEQEALNTLISDRV